jgi:hypothetical protein
MAHPHLFGLAALVWGMLSGVIVACWFALRGRSMARGVDAPYARHH